MTGIVNLGATCYVNTAIKCLISVPHFSTTLLHLKSEENRDKEFIVKFQALCKELLSGNSRVVNPMEFVKVLIKEIRVINILEQNDINEFLTFFLARLLEIAGQNVYDRMLHITKQIKYKKTAYDRQKEKMDMDWVQKVGKEYSKLTPVLYGQHINQIICKMCNKIVHNYELFQDVSLALEGNSLEDCFAKHFTDIVLNEWRCDACRQDSHGSKRTILIWRPPQMLVICLKRFDYDPSRRMFVKNTKSISIPEFFDIEKYVIGRSAAKYQLCSAAIHSGSYYGGHYHAVCKDANGTWYRHDDDYVSSMGGVMPLDVSQAYLLFYSLLTN